MKGVLTDEAIDTGEQSVVTMDEELFISVCDTIDAFDRYLAEIDQLLDYTAAFAEEEVAVAFV